jgi:hypothetical protein
MKTTGNMTLRPFILILSLLVVAPVLERTAVLAQVSGGWIITSSMNIPRAVHTATLLLNGKVLVVGGNNGTGPVSSAELYNPTTGMWSITASLNTARYGHTATLLQDGKVLVAGGWNGSYLNSAELYDPTTGKLSVTGSLNTARYGHTATLLPDGKVLVAGGGFVLNTAELYDPNTGRWSITANLNTARSSHTATLLPSGKVLVAGGFTGHGFCPCIDLVTASAELYDPVTAGWNVTENLNTARALHTATLLQNGKILVAGGTDGRVEDFPEYVPLASAELYDAGTGSWSVTDSLHTARNSHTATMLFDGKVLAAAGYYTASAELYDQETDRWNITGSLNATHLVEHTPAILLSDGKVLVPGSPSELYDQTAVGRLLPPPPLSINTPVLPDAEVGVAYVAPLVSGGLPPYTINLVKGVFPQGLSDELASGALSGTPISSRRGSFTAQITDDLGASVTGTFTVKILRALGNTTRTLKTGITGKPYKTTLKVAGGKAPYNWSLASGNLPAGLSLDGLTGVIFGIPTEAGTFDLTFNVSDPVGGIAQKDLALTIK